MIHLTGLFLHEPVVEPGRLNHWLESLYEVILCAQPYEELCRLAAAAGAILTADFIGREYHFQGIAAASARVLSRYRSVI